jgi:hypothetical protein
MQNQGLVPHLVKLLKQLVCFDLFVNKDEDAAFVIPLAKELHQTPELIIWLHNFHKLLYIGTGLTSVAYHHLNGRVKDLFG